MADTALPGSAQQCYNPQYRQCQGRYRYLRNQSIYKTRHVPLHKSLSSPTQPSSGHFPELGPHTCTSGSTQQKVVRDLEVICALLTGTILSPPLKYCQSRLEGDVIRSYFFLKVWVRKGVLSQDG